MRVVRQDLVLFACRNKSPTNGGKEEERGTAVTDHTKQIVRWLGCFHSTLGKQWAKRGEREWEKKGRGTRTRVVVMATGKILDTQ